MEPYTSTGYLILGFDELTFRLVDMGPVAMLDDFSDWLTEKNAPAGLISMSDGLKESLSGYFPREFGMYGDKFGRWVSAYAPIANADGELVAAVGVDFQADYVETVRQSILDRMLTALGVTYVILFVLVFGASQFFTRPIVELTEAAENIGEGDYEQDLSSLGAGRFTDEIGRLSDVFAIMVDKVYQREQTLLKQVAELKIEIDSSKQKEEVDEIVESEFFQDLQKKAGKMRKDRDKDK
jgi:methyl-accepting chemotaxis protein